MDSTLPDSSVSPGWVDRAYALRDRWLASPAFRNWAARFPLTRFLAQRRARQLFDLCAGFVYSQVLSACVKVRLFDILAEGPQTLHALALRLDLPPDGAQRLVRAAVSLGLAADRGRGRYGLGQLGAALVGNDGILSMVEHHRLLYADLEDPLALLRGVAGPTRLSAYWPYAGVARPAELDSTQVAAYSKLMSASQSLIASEILDAYPLRRHRCLMDVGGGEGTFLAAAGAVAPSLRLILFDLPAVAERARLRFQEQGLGGRAQACGGDFRVDVLPRGADIASVVRVLFDHDDANALAILRAVRAALPTGGTLLLAEPMAGTAGAEPMGDAYFGFYLLAMGRGRSRTPDEIGRLLAEAGFGNVRIVPTRMPLQTRLLVASASVISNV
ncbi:MAG: methyltransferase [Betaproteobacteria bacterium]|jgi:demethylspheroidene O-methyltransferase